jgi:hypothetical protein
MSLNDFDSILVLIHSYVSHISSTTITYGKMINDIIAGLISKTSPFLE